MSSATTAQCISPFRDKMLMSGLAVTHTRAFCPPCADLQRLVSFACCLPAAVRLPVSVRDSSTLPFWQLMHQRVWLRLIAACWRSSTPVAMFEMGFANKFEIAVDSLTCCADRKLCRLA